MRLQREWLDCSCRRIWPLFVCLRPPASGDWENHKLVLIMWASVVNSQTACRHHARMSRNIEFAALAGSLELILQELLRIETKKRLYERAANTNTTQRTRPGY